MSRSGYMQRLDPNHILDPAYYCLLEPSCTYSVGKCIRLIAQHVQEMEPGASLEVGVWLPSCALDAEDAEDHRLRVVREVQGIVQQRALPTLICMEQQVPHQEQQRQLHAQRAGQQQGAGGQHARVLTLYRMRAGLEGFQGAMFGAPRIAYMA